MCKTEVKCSHLEGEEKGSSIRLITLLHVPLSSVHSNSISHIIIHQWIHIIEKRLQNIHVMVMVVGSKFLNS